GVLLRGRPACVRGCGHSVILRGISHNPLEEKSTAMTAKPSIDPAEFLHEHLSQASPDLLRELMQGFVNTLLSADADSVCGAAYGVRDEARTNRRNGYRRRELDTRVG